MANKTHKFFYFLGLTDTKAAARMPRGAARYFAASIAYFAAAILLGGAVAAFGAIPFGIALLCSQKRGVPYTFAGAVTGAFAFGGGAVLPLIVVYALCFGGRVAVSGWLRRGSTELFGEPIGLRVMMALLGAFVASLFSVLSNSFLFYDLFAMLVMCVLAALGAFLFAGMTAAVETDAFVSSALAGILTRVWKWVGCVALVAALCFSGRGMAFFGFSVGLVLAAIFTYTAAIATKKYGFIYGAVVGAVGGAACGLMFAPLFAIIGLLCGAVKRVGEVTAICAALFCGITYSLYVGGFESFIFATPNIVCGTILFLPVARFALGRRLKSVKDAAKGAASKKAVSSDDLTAAPVSSEATAAKTAFEKALSTSEESRLRQISAKLRSTSEEIAGLSEDLRYPGTPEVAMLCEAVRRNRCSGCKNYDRCIERDLSPALNSLASSALSVGYLKREDAPAELLARCGNAEGIIAEMNGVSTAIYSEYAASERSVKIGLLAHGLTATASAVERAVSEAEEESRIDRELSSAAAEVAVKIGLRCDAVSVYGRRRRRLLLTGVDACAIKESGEELSRLFSSVCLRRLSAPKITMTDGYASASMESVEAFNAEFAEYGQRREGEGINGDTIATFDSTDGRFYVMLSDGMGSGCDAARASSACCAYARKIISGCPSIGGEALFALLGDFLREGSSADECAATGDLFELDRFTGEARFRKSGAAPSYAVRGGKIFKISARTMPLGVTSDADSEEVGISLRGGDIIVMTSDGVGSDEDSSVALVVPRIIEEELNAAAASGNRTIDIRALSRRIVAEAARARSRSDDVTVGVIRVV